MFTIRLVYNKCDIQNTLDFIYFFRLIGIYVSEDYWDKEVIELPKSMFDIKIKEFVDFDFYVFFVSKESDLLHYNLIKNKLSKNKYILFRTQELLSTSEGYDINNDNKKNLMFLLESLKANRIISNIEKSEYEKISDIFFKNDFSKHYYLLKYFYKIDRVDSYATKQNLQNVFNELMASMSDSGCKWGEIALLRTQLACLRLIYEINLFCRKNGENDNYDSDTLLALCKKIDEVADEKLGNSVKVLMGNIYNDLLSDPNKAYECYVAGCTEKYGYDAYLYFMKASYWQNDAQEYDKAIKYFEISLKIYPEYYRAWYRLGRCFQYKADFASASTCFYNVKQCLNKRYENNVLRPLEFDYLFKAEMQLSIINIKLKEYGRALENALNAKAIIDSISNSRFFNIVFDNEKISKYKKITRKNLPENKMLDTIGILYDIIGDQDKAREYRALKKSTKE